MKIAENIKGNRYLGVDPGLAHLGLAIVEVGDAGLHCLTTARVNTYSYSTLGCRLEKLYTSINDYIEKFAIKGAACESPSFGSQSAPYSLGAAHGMVHLATWRNQVPLLRVAPQQLHKFAAGVTATKGATKEVRAARMKLLVRKGLEAAFGFDLTLETSSDPVDATGMAVIAAAFFGGITFSVRKKDEVVAAVSLYDNFN